MLKQLNYKESMHCEKQKRCAVEVNRNILGTPNLFSLKTGVAVAYKKAIMSPLNPCPLSICHADGSWQMRKGSNEKSDLKDILLNNAKSLSLEEIKIAGSNVVVIDIIGLINYITFSPDTYEELEKIFVAKLPKGYKIIDIVTEC